MTSNVLWATSWCFYAVHVPPGGVHALILVLIWWLNNLCSWYLQPPNAHVARAVHANCRVPALAASILRTF